MASLLLHELRLRRRALIGWAIGLAFFAVLYMAFYPALPEEMRNLDVESIEIYKSLGVETMATFDGYLQSSVLNFLPLLVGAFGIVLGVGALAGEEDAGTLENLAALPASRLGLYGAKASAILVGAVAVLLFVGLATAASFLAIESQIDTPATAADLFWVMLAHALVAWVFLGLGLFLGALLPGRGTALAAASVVLVATFFGNNLAGMVTELETVQPLTPFYHFRQVADMLTGDVPWEHVAVLVLMAASSLVLGAVSFQRRDLTVGAWPWQRPRPGAMAQQPARRAVDRRRTAVALAVLALAACSCVSLGVVAASRSDDVEADLRELVGLETGDRLEAAAEVSAWPAPVTAPVSGVVVAVGGAPGDDVALGAGVVAVTGAEDAAVQADAQQLLELGWAFVDEIEAGAAEDGEALGRVAEAFDGVAADLERALADARAGGEPERRLAELARRADLARAAARVAEARLAIAEDRVSPADVQAVEVAVGLAEEALAGQGAGIEMVWAAAPAAGTVTRVAVLPGDTVSRGDVVAELETGGKREMSIDVSREDAEPWRAGDLVTVDVEGYDESFSGEVLDVVRFAEGGGEREDGDDDEAYRVRLAVDDPSRLLRPGERLDVLVRRADSSDEE